MPDKKKLIEVALPLDAINNAAIREKSIRHGHPSTLHLWWARRPLAATRAVIFSSLVDDPSSDPLNFPTDESQTKERKRLFRILEELVKWENSDNKELLDRAKHEIMQSNNGILPTLLDPFAGGGAIPLEAQRFGLKSYAHDLNPIAVMINKAMIEIPPDYDGHSPINPESSSNLSVQSWPGSTGLAEDVRYYGEWIKKKAYEKIGHLYPKVEIPRELGGGEATVIAWIWARTVKCPNPVCGCVIPLVSSFELSKRKGKEAYVLPSIDNLRIRYSVKLGKDAPEGTIIHRKGARCLKCGSPTDFIYIRNEAKGKRMGAEMMAIVAEGRNGRIFLNPDEIQVEKSRCSIPEGVPTGELPEKALGINIKAYGFENFSDLFTNRQLTALTTFSDLVNDVQSQIMLDGGDEKYAKSIGVYLAFLVDQLANHSSSVCGWNSPNTQMRSVFSRQAIQMVWDYAECNVFSGSSGSFENLLERQVKAFEMLPTNIKGVANQFDAQTDCGLRDIMISTDPPYYDNIGYADLSDFFYIWLRKSLKTIYPDLFRTILVPKIEELVANPFKFEGSKDKANAFFEDGMLKTFRQIYSYAQSEIPVTVYYAYKQSEDDNNNIASTGWETILSAIIQSGFSITGTWPLSTEKVGRSRDNSSNALASSIVLVCRKRSMEASICTRRDFVNILRRELKGALKKLQLSNIAPVDLAQSAIGPGMAVFSRYSKVLEADGSPMSVRDALYIINQEVDHFFSEQDGELDSESRFCIDLYSQFAFNEVKFGEADVLARAKNTSVERLASEGIISAQKGIVRLLNREEVPNSAENLEKIVWFLTQKLTYEMEVGGITSTARIISGLIGINPEHAKSLAYRLFIIAERKGWNGEAYAYNSLVTAWPDILIKVSEIQAQSNNIKQISIFDEPGN